MTRRVTAGGIAVVLLLGATGVWARQQHPDLSGRWRPVEPGRESEVLVVRHEGPSLDLVSTDGRQTDRISVTIGGAVSQVVHRGSVEVTSEAAWHAAALNLRHVFRAVPAARVISERQEVLSIDDAGHLVVEATTTRDGRRSPTVRSVYRRE